MQVFIHRKHKMSLSSLLTEIVKKAFSMSAATVTPCTQNHNRILKIFLNIEAIIEGTLSETSEIFIF